jgi:nitrate/TMAO reductase-like tetraheme cytochrome c subunit
MPRHLSGLGRGSRSHSFHKTLSCTNEIWLSVIEKGKNKTRKDETKRNEMNKREIKRNQMNQINQSSDNRDCFSTLAMTAL